MINNDNIIKIPKVSVLMPVYNGGKFIKESIDSVLTQSYKYFELIIINDASIDNTKEIIMSYSDTRIRIINNNKNVGISNSRNIGINEAKGEYIAWLDSDDICFPLRLEKQVNFLDGNLNCGLCSSNLISIDEKGNIISGPWFDYKNIPMEIIIFFQNPIAQSTVMLRKNILKKNNLYYKDIYAEDYDLWCNIVLVSRMYRLEDILVKYRTSSTSAFHSNIKFSYEQSIKSINNMIKKIIGDDPPPFHKYITIYSNIPEGFNYEISILKIYNWYESLLKKAKEYWGWDKKIYYQAKKYIVNRINEFLFNFPLRKKIQLLFQLIINFRIFKFIKLFLYFFKTNGKIQSLKKKILK